MMNKAVLHINDTSIIVRETKRKKFPFAVEVGSLLGDEGRFDYMFDCTLEQLDVLAKGIQAFVNLHRGGK